MRDENMSYTVKSSERLRKSGSEAETKALLYLMNFRPDSDDIYYFVVDFFNDLTGMDNIWFASILLSRYICTHSIPHHW